MSASYGPASLTVGDLDMRTDIGVEASTPAANNPMPSLLDTVVVKMLTAHAGDPTRAPSLSPRRSSERLTGPATATVGPA